MHSACTTACPWHDRYQKTGGYLAERSATIGGAESDHPSPTDALETVPACPGLLMRFDVDVPARKAQAAVA